jgi:myo-inositol-1(or 4)-monophosphatase
VREAGALALSLFRTELKNWTKGASSPVSEADIAVNDLVESGCARDAGLWLAVGRKRRRRARLGKPLVWIVDPIDGTRAYLAGREDWCVSVALVRMPRRCWRRCSRRPATSSSSRCAGRARRATTGVCRDRGHRSGFFPAWPVRKPLVQRLSPSPDEITLSSANRIAGAAAVPGRARQPRCRFAGGQSRDWDLAAANLIVQEADGRMTALSGDAIEYNRREVAHGVLVAAGHDRHARIVEHFRTVRCPDGRNASTGRTRSNLAINCLPGTSLGKIIMPDSAHRNCFISSSAAN